MRVKLLHKLLFSVCLAGAAPVLAHHGMSAVFDFNQRFSRSGTLVRLDWRNPHIYLYVEALEADGKTQIWAYEGPSPVHFRRSSSAGKAVHVNASRARDGTMRGLIRAITLANGKFVPLCPDNC